MKGLIATAFERIIQSNSTAVGLNTTTKAAVGSFLRLSVETNNVRFRMDSTAPTQNTGVLLPKDNAYEMEGFTSEANLKFFRAAGGTAVINVQRYKYPGESE